MMLREVKDLLKLKFSILGVIVILALPFFLDPESSFMTQTPFLKDLPFFAVIVIAEAILLVVWYSLYRLEWKKNFYFK